MTLANSKARSLALVPWDGRGRCTTSTGLVGLPWYFQVREIERLGSNEEKPRGLHLGALLFGVGLAASSECGTEQLRDGGMATTVGLLVRQALKLAALRGIGAGRE